MAARANFIGHFADGQKVFHDPGVVDQDVERTERARRRLDHLVDIFLLCDVPGDADGFPAARFNL